MESRYIENIALAIYDFNYRWFFFFFNDETSTNLLETNLSEYNLT